MVYLLCLVLFCVGMCGVLTQRNLIKIILSLAVVESAVDIFIVLLGYRVNGIAPIESSAVSHADFVSMSVDPLPQAMVLTAIVIGLGVLALSIVIAMRLYQQFGTYDITKINKLQG